MPLVECIPNFSEGRRAEVIESVVKSIADVEGVYVLDCSSDPDHNRTVVTFAGVPEVVTEAAFQGIKTAAALIDLDLHNGVHPRIGAADVVPFVPLRDVTLRECVMLAQALGQRVANELNIPVYLYEKAALRPERANLAVVRRDAYEKLKTTIQTDPDRAPDYGLPVLGRAGAVAIGARAPLIAFNAYLDTSDVEIAKKIARTVRELGGGLPYLKALGLLVGGRAQVSMNVIDYRKTSLFAIMEALRAAAAQQDAAITHTELVGLIPQAALMDTALSYLQLPVTTHDLTLEKQLGLRTGDYREIDFE